jgi:hypothetical protein
VVGKLASMHVLLYEVMTKLRVSNPRHAMTFLELTILFDLGHRMLWNEVFLSKMIGALNVKAADHLKSIDKNYFMIHQSNLQPCLAKVARRILVSQTL